MVTEEQVKEAIVEALGHAGGAIAVLQKAVAAGGFGEKQLVPGQQRQLGTRSVSGWGGEPRV